MKLGTYLILLILFFQSRLCLSQINYPLTPKGNSVDTFFNHVVEDPYRWMESPGDTNLTKWLTQQEKLTLSEKKSFKGYGEAYTGIEQNADFYFTSILKDGPYYFSYYLRDDHSSASLYFRRDIDDEPELLFSPSEVKGSRGEVYNIMDFQLSEDANYLAILISESGSDWREIRVLDMKTKNLMIDRVEWVKFSDVVWNKNGFFYKRYASQSRDRKLIDHSKGSSLCFHKLGTLFNEDKLIYQSEYGNEDFEFTSAPSNKKLLFIHHVLHRKGKALKAISTIQTDSINEQIPIPFILLPITTENEYDVIDCNEDSVLIKTDFHASNHSIYKYKLGQINSARILIPEYYENLQLAFAVNNRLFCLYYNDGKYMYVVFDMQGEKIDLVKMPVGTCIENVSFNPSKSEVIFYKTSFLYPAVVYKLDISNLQIKTIGQSTVNFDVLDYKSEVRTYITKDSTVIPMYITYHVDTDLDGKNPTILYGYGGFGVTATPFFDPMYIEFMKRGGIVAMPAIRGGGEYGKKWHDAGKRLNKQVSFNDFMDAAYFLFENKYTNPQKLILAGGSNGGLLVAAVVTQHPEICKAAIPSVGVYDMLRFAKFTVGPYHLNEFGDVSNKIDFENIYSYSPLHHVSTDKTYPSILFITGDHDDRVPPFQTYKFLATLQENGAHRGGPFLLYLEENAGHYGNMSSEGRLRQRAYVLSFIKKYVGFRD